MADVTGGAGKVLGGGAPAAAAAGKGLLGTVLPYALVAAGGVIIGKEIGQAINANTINPAKANEQGAFKQNLVNNQNDIGALQKSLDAIDSQLKTSDPTAQVALIASRIPYIGDALGNVAPELEKQRADLVAAIAAEKDRLYNQQQRVTGAAAGQRAKAAAAMAKIGVTSLAGNSIAKSAAATTNARIATLAGIDRQTASAARTTHERIATLAGIDRTTAANTGVIAKKDFSPTFHANINLPIVLSVTATGHRLVSREISIGGRATLD